MINLIVLHFFIFLVHCSERTNSAKVPFVKMGPPGKELFYRKEIRGGLFWRRYLFILSILFVY
jgi:hypothetical protein